jgi:hypothetical protein
VSGRNTIFYDPDIKATAKTSGDVIAEIRIEPSIAEDLAQHAVCYQEIKYNHLCVRINGQASSLTQGSSILSFCADPADRIPDGISAINWARSNYCSKSGKYWETVEISIPHREMIGPNGGFFKNNVGTSDTPRTYSPGFISYVAISPPNQSTPLEIELEWNVTMRGRTLNRQVDEGPQTTMSQENFGVVGSVTADTPYIEALKAYVPQEDGTIAERDLTPYDFSPPIIPEVYYFLPTGQLTITGNTGGSGAPTAAIATHLAAGTDGKVSLYRYLVSSNTFETINPVAQPYPDAAPTFRDDVDFRADPVSPAYGKAPRLGFLQTRLQESRSRRRRSARPTAFLRPAMNSSPRSSNPSVVL